MDSLHHWPLPMVRFHRALLIVATVGVAVAASRVATDVSEVGAWLLTAAFALLLVVADLAREVEEAAQSLSDSSGQSRHDARRDIFATRYPKSISKTLTVVVVLVIASAVAYSWHDITHPHKRPSVPHPTKHGHTTTSVTTTQ
jgi:hypothetical protein